MSLETDATRLSSGRDLTSDSVMPVTPHALPDYYKSYYKPMIEEFLNQTSSENFRALLDLAHVRIADVQSECEGAHTQCISTFSGMNSNPSHASAGFAGNH